MGEEGGLCFADHLLHRAARYLNSTGFYSVKSLIRSRCHRNACNQIAFTWIPLTFGTPVQRMRMVDQICLQRFFAIAICLTIGPTRRQPLSC